ncbi:MAG TPA: deoxyguanosinetriphosphate triphosphohydrolase, partial [Actinomycetaceae bacterium]|nr:deoxyguanosinetriphosphate triphosphohydrolase [Actinomycetaceae bacterium]
RAWYDPDVTDDELGEALRRLITLPEWVRHWDGTRGDLAALKNLTSQLIGRFCGAAHDATREAAGEGPLTRYAADLVVPAATTAEIVVLKGVAAHYVMAPREQEPMHGHQRRVLQELVGALVDAGPQELEAPFVADWHAAEEAGRLRVIIDQVASLTDASAHAWHDRLCSGGSASPSRIAAWRG